MMLGRLAIPESRAAGSINLMLRKEIVRSSFVLNSVTLTLNELSLWSEMGRSNAAQLEGVTPEQQSRSREWPFEWVGKLINCCKSKLSRHDIKSLVRYLLPL